MWYVRTSSIKILAVREDAELCKYYSVLCVNTSVALQRYVEPRARSLKTPVRDWSDPRRDQAGGLRIRRRWMSWCSVASIILDECYDSAATIL